MRKKLAVFKDLAWIDDSFHALDNFKSPKGWTVTVGEYETDGDIATLRGEIQADLSNIESDSFGNLFTSVLGGNGQLFIKVKSGGSWSTVKSLKTISGVTEDTIPAGLTITKIAISSTEGPVLIDYVGISGSSPIIERDDIYKLKVELVSTVTGSNANIDLVNRNKKFNLVDKGDRIIVWVGDTTETKVFGGTVSKIRRKWPQKTINILAADLGKTSLNREFASVVDAEFIGASVTTILSTITYGAVQAGDFSLQNFETLINPATGSELALTVTFSKSNEKQALQDLATAAKEAGVQADFRLNPQGDLIFHASGQKASGKTVIGDDGGTVISNEHVPASKVINRVIVFTPNMVKLPRGGDAFTELPSEQIQWKAKFNYEDGNVASISIYPDSSKFKFGGASKKLIADLDASTTAYVQVDLDLGDDYDLTKFVKFYMSYFAATAYSESVFQIRFAEDLDADGDSTKYYHRNVAVTKNAWQDIDFDTGENADGWTASGISDWTSIRYIVLRITKTSVPMDIDFWFDGLHVAKGAKYYAAENATSISTYGREVGQFVREDILTEDDAEAYYNGILELFGVPRNNELSIVKGDPTLTPAYNITLQIPDEDIDAIYRMTKVVHKYGKKGFTSEVHLTATATAYWTSPSLGYLGSWLRPNYWATLGIDILPIWG